MVHHPVIVLAVLMKRYVVISEASLARWTIGVFLNRNRYLSTLVNDC